MLSAIGLQEFELTGSYRVNHALHGAQLASLWLLCNAVPHFGLLHRSGLSVEYARNFYDSDQRPLRLVSECYRERDHFMQFRRPMAFVDLLIALLNATRRQQAYFV